MEAISLDIGRDSTVWYQLKGGKILEVHYFRD